MAKELDNMKMWASLTKYSKVSWVTTMLKKALKDQGFEFKDGEIISIKTDPCDGCKMASGGCTLTCRKWKEYYKISGQKQELSHSEPTKKSDQELTEFEKAVGVAIGSWNPDEEGKKRVRAVANKLLSIASKQKESRIDVDAMVEQFINNLPAYTVIHEDVDKRLWGEPYRRGIEDTLKAIEGGQRYETD